MLKDTLTQLSIDGEFATALKKLNWKATGTKIIFDETGMLDEVLMGFKKGSIYVTAYMKAKSAEMFSLVRTDSGQQNQVMLMFRNHALFDASFADQMYSHFIKSLNQMQ